MGGMVPQTMPKYLSIKYLMISKKNWHPSLSQSKKYSFGVPFWEDPREVVSPNDVNTFVS